jgi:hypothetical protein
MMTALIAVSATAAVVAGVRASRAARAPRASAPAYDRLPPGTCPCGRSHDNDEPMTVAGAA